MNVSLSSPSSLDLGSVAYDVRKSFNPLAAECLIDFEVSAIRDGYVVLSFALPEGMTRVFVAMLESMAGLFKFMDLKIKAKSAEVKAIDPDRKEYVRKAREQFTTDVCKLYDLFIKEGQPVNKAVSLTNFALKEKEHPWANLETVRRTIGATGRFRTKRGVISK